MPSDDDKSDSKVDPAVIALIPAAAVVHDVLTAAGHLFAAPTDREETDR